MRTWSWKAMGSLEGTGSDLYVCCGFVPDIVRIYNLNDGTNMEQVDWNVGMTRAATMSAGKSLNKASSMTQTVLTTTVGVAPYYGGDVVSTASTTYLIANPDPDQRGNGSTTYIKKWTKDSATTGHFDGGLTVTGNRACKAGTRFNVNGVWYTIDSLSNDGDAAGDVTVFEAAPNTGPVYGVLSTFDFIPIDATILNAYGTQVTPPGFRIDSAVGAVSTDGDVAFFMAG